MAMAQKCAMQSVANRKKVGCVIVLKCGAVAHGWNGMPSGSTDESCEGADGLTKSDVIHAEDNALMKVSALDCSGSVAFVTLSPCYDCAEKLIKAGVGKVIYLNEYKCDSGLIGLESNGVIVEKYVDV